MTQRQILAIAVGLLLAAGAASALISRSGQGSKAIWLLDGWAGFGQPNTNGGPQGASNELAPLESPARYLDPTYGFSFEIPPGASVKAFADERGDVVLIEGSSAADFQVFISPFDEPGPLTTERLRQDLPQLATQHPRPATLAGIPALIFHSRDPSLGDLYEVWLVHNGSLYQITITAAHEAELNEILASWKFN